MVERDMDICRPRDHKGWSRPETILLWSVNGDLLQCILFSLNGRIFYKSKEGEANII